MPLKGLSVSGLFSEHHELSEGGLGDGVVEVFILVEPLVGKFSVSVLAHGFVDRVQVLHSSDLVDEGMGRLEDGLIVVLNAEWEPSLHDLRLDGVRDVQVEVNSCKNVYVHVVLVLIRLESVHEKDLLVGSPLVKALEIEW